MQRLFWFAAIAVPALASTSTSIPLSFEQRDESLFVARFANPPVRFGPDGIEIGGVTMRFEGARRDARLEGLGPAVPATYLGVGSRRTFRQYGKLAIRGLYPGIDAIVYGNSGRLEYDLEIAPRARTAALRLHFENARGVHITADGALIAETATGELRQLPPVVRQGGSTVRARYQLIGGNRVIICLGSYDRRRALTIDPVLVYEKYFGGSGSDNANYVATDPEGNVYVAGTTTSPDFLAVDGASHTVLAPLLALTNGGQTVTSLPVANETSVSALGGTPDGRILYLGAGSHVYLSTDSGAHWTLTGPLPVLVFTPSAGAVAIRDISVDAIDPSRAYVATNQGLYSTGDGGQSWFPRDFGLAGNFEAAIDGVQVTVSQADHTVLYATTGNPNYLYKSSDAAGTWTPLNPLYPGEPVPGLYPGTKILFRLAPGSSDLYVINNNGNLVKSADGGATWQQLAGRLFGATALAIDAIHPANLFVLDNFGVQKSVDGGRTFTTVNPPGVQTGSSFAGMTYEPQSGTLYATENTTVYASTDQGATWKAVPLAASEFYTFQAIGGRAFVGITTPASSYVVKFDPAGPRLLYSTFFTNSPVTGIAAMAVDQQGSAYLAGNVYSQNFTTGRQLSPASPPSVFSSWVAKLTADGKDLAYFSTMGASKGQYIQAIAVDSAGALYLTGGTSSPDFAITQGAVQTALPSVACTRTAVSSPFEIVNLAQWAFVSKVAPDGGGLVYSTFLGGTCGSRGEAVAVNAAGEAYVGALTTTPDMPVTADAFQGTFPGDPNQAAGYPHTLSVGYAARLSAGGDKLLAGTYVGGGYLTGVTAIALDSSGNPVLAGYTWGIATGATAGAYQKSVVYQCMEPFSIGPAVPPSNGDDAFLLKLDPALSKPAFLTYLGGSCGDAANSLALDSQGNAWIAGSTYSADFPIVDPFEARNGTAGFVSQMSGDGSKLLFSSAADVSSMALDSHGSVYLAGSSYTAPAKAAGQSAAVLSRIDPAPNPVVEIDSVRGVSLNTNSPAMEYFGEAVAPGQLVSIKGHNLGPASKFITQLDSSGRLPFRSAGTAVMFGNNAAPLISVQDTEIVCLVPFAVAQLAVVSVESGAGKSNPLEITTAASAAETLAVINPDGTVNSASNPAPAGSVVALYVSGLGVTNPPSTDGQVNASSTAVPVATPTVWAGTGVVTPQFVGAAVGLIAGITQINLQIPPGDYPQGMTVVSVNNSGAPVYVKQGEG